jgi:hypothetical protein
VRFAGISFAPGEYLRVASDVQHSCNKRGRGPRVGAPTHYSPNVVLGAFSEVGQKCFKR